MNKKELFLTIKVYEEFIHEYKGIMSEEHLKKVTETLVNYKREVRKKPRIDEIEILVKDYGIDGYVYKQDVTDFGYDFDSYTKEMIEETLEEHRTHCIPSQFDCTGQRFTQWNKLVKLGGRWWYYESVGFDV